MLSRVQRLLQGQLRVSCIDVQLPNSTSTRRALYYPWLMQRPPRRDRCTPATPLALIEHATLLGSPAAPAKHLSSIMTRSMCPSDPNLEILSRLDQ